MDLNHSHCDCHACTQQRAAECLGGLSVGLRQMNNISNAHATGGILGQLGQQLMTTPPLTREEIKQTVHDAIVEGFGKLLVFQNFSIRPEGSEK